MIDRNSIAAVEGGGRPGQRAGPWIRLSPGPRRLGIPPALASYNARSKTEFSTSVFAPIRHSKADLVVFAGFLALVKIPTDYKGRVINVHPSLIPSFSGKGFYGSKVHKAVLAMGAKLSGCTIHFADDDYDNGPIIAQRPVPVLEDDNIETLAARVFQEECKALPDAIALYAEGRLKLEGRLVRVAPRV